MPPHDLVAIFRASFHPTKGNVLDWSLTANLDLDLDLDSLQLEFSALPSGLHLVHRDVVYFSKQDHHALAVFHRRPTARPGHRGVRLSSLGVLLAKSPRPRPWRHLDALRAVVDQMYARDDDEDEDEDEDEDDWEPARRFFEERKVRDLDHDDDEDEGWTGWSDELDGAFSEPISSHPTLHLPHLLRLLGPSSLTLYKHVLGRRRILIYASPPVELACVLCRVAADLCFDVQLARKRKRKEEETTTTLPLLHPDPIAVLGMITLADLDRLQAESGTGRGWIACTTDAIFMEKPSCYDLLVDLTTLNRPTFYSSKPVVALCSQQPGGPSRAAAAAPTHRLSTIRFAWSDVKLWNEIDRILQLNSDATHANPCSGSGGGGGGTIWTDAWRIYEDVCIICAGLWMGNWRGNNSNSNSKTTTTTPADDGDDDDGNWGSIRLDGDDDGLSLRNMGGSSSSSSANNNKSNGKEKKKSSRTQYVRNLGMGIEGRPVVDNNNSDKSTRRVSAVSWSSGKATIVGTTPAPAAAMVVGDGKSAASSSGRQDGGGGEGVALTGLKSEGRRRDVDSEEDAEREREGADQARRRLLSSQVSTTMALLQTLHAHAAFQLSVLEDLLARRVEQQQQRQKASSSSSSEEDEEEEEMAEVVVVVLTTRDMVAFELGPFSELDARYLEWLAAEYAPPPPPPTTTTTDGQEDDSESRRRRRRRRGVPRPRVKVVVKSGGWRDLLSAIFFV